MDTPYMEAFGRVTSFLVASANTGGILLERIYNPAWASQANRLALHKALFQSAQAEGLVSSESESESEGDSQVFAGSYRRNHLVFQKRSDTLIFITGSKEFGPLLLSQLLEAFAASLGRDILKKGISEEMILKNYAKVCVHLEQFINEGLIQTVDMNVIAKNMKF